MTPGRRGRAWRCRRRRILWRESRGGTPLVSVEGLGFECGGGDGEAAHGAVVVEIGRAHV